MIAIKSLGTAVLHSHSCLSARMAGKAGLTMLQTFLTRVVTVSGLKQAIERAGVKPEDLEKAGSYQRKAGGAIEQV